MKKHFKRQEESIYRKFKDMNTAMEKNQDSIMNAINILNTSMKKQQGQVDSLQKRQEKEVEQSEGANVLGTDPMRINTKTTLMRLRILFMTCSRSRALPLIEALQPPRQKVVMQFGAQIN
eukprot:5499540-Ditylum_brightwellii.AAC.2